MPDEVQNTQHLWFLNTLIKVQVAHDESADGISVIEIWAPYGDSPPLHVHHSEDEVFHLLEGEFRFQVGEKELRLGAGETFLAPKGISHTYRVESTTGGHFLAITTQGDFERFVRALSRPAERHELPQSSGPPTPEDAQALSAIAAKHKVELVGPPLH